MLVETEFNKIAHTHVQLSARIYQAKLSSEQTNKQASKQLKCRKNQWFSPLSKICKIIARSFASNNRSTLSLARTANTTKLFHSNSHQTPHTWKHLRHQAFKHSFHSSRQKFTYAHLYWWNLNANVNTWISLLIFNTNFNLTGEKSGFLSSVFHCFTLTFWFGLLLLLFFSIEWCRRCTIYWID